MLIEEIKTRVNKFTSVEKDFFVETVQSLRNRELYGVEQSFKDIETLNDLFLEEILNAVKEVELLNEEGKKNSIRKKNEILNKVLIRTLDL